MTRDKHGWRFNGALLRSQRTASKRTQRQVAAELGVAVASVVWWETGRKIPEPLRLPVVARAYGCKIDDLFVPVPK
jgi:transcriptional regulator with XRE-family HTH domain